MEGNRTTTMPGLVGLGTGVERAWAHTAWAALARVRHPHEELIGAFLLAGSPDWSLLLVLIRHHIARIALAPDLHSARVLAVPFERVRSGPLEVHLGDGEWITIGDLAHPSDGALVAEAAAHLRLPEGSDGRSVFTREQVVESYRWTAG